MIKMCKLEKALVCFCCLLAIAIIMPLIDMAISETEIINVVLLEKNYKPASTQTGVGINTNEQTTSIMTSESESYTFLINYNGSIKNTEVAIETYTKFEKGDEVQLPIRRGGISKKLYF